MDGNTRTMMLKFTKDQKQLTFTVPAGQLAVSKKLPGLIKRAGARVTMDTSAEGLEFILKHFPEIEWETEVLNLYEEFMLEEQQEAEPLSKGFEFKLPPYAHQLAAWERSKDEEVFALLMEMGTGKTKVLIDTAAYLMVRGEIDSVIGFAPNGVHTNWVKEELPKHWPTEVPLLYTAWSSSMRKAGKDKFDAVCAEKNSLCVFNIEGIATPKGRAAVRRFLSGRNCLIFVDESTRIKTPSTKRTQAAIRAANSCRYRRILTGSPAPNGPFDLYSQFKFLDERILGFKNYQSYKFQYGIFEKLKGRDGEVKLDKRGNEIEVAVGYKNVDDINQKIRAVSYRVTKEECLDLPPKVYRRHHVQLTSEQWKHYNELAEQYFTEFEGGLITTEIALTRLIRFRQITGGFLDGKPFKENPKLEQTINLVEDYSEQTIIWASFIPEMEALQKELGDRAVWYRGKNKETALTKFKAGDAQFFIANPQSAGLGLTITEATQTIYYSSSHNYEHRVQSEDRNHRIGQENKVTYTDMVADGTCDIGILGDLLTKDHTSTIITGDKVRQWIRP